MRLNLQSWRNFTEVEVDLQRRVFLVGPNASGKSNFLDVFRFLRLDFGTFDSALTKMRLSSSTIVMMGVYNCS